MLPVIQEYRHTLRHVGATVVAIIEEASQGLCLPLSKLIDVVLIAPPTVQAATYIDGGFAAQGIRCLRVVIATPYE